MQNVLERICHWFQRSNESKHSDFDLMFAFNLGLQTVVNMHPEKRFVVDELAPTESDKISGAYIVADSAMLTLGVVNACEIVVDVNCTVGALLRTSAAAVAA